MGKFNELVEKMLSPLSEEALLKSGGSRAYLDISLKFVPICPETGEKVR